MRPSSGKSELFRVDSVAEGLVGGHSAGAADATRGVSVGVGDDA